MLSIIEPVSGDKPRLCFFTNMPTPYQLDFFEALGSLCHLQVIYFTTREADRSWNLKTDHPAYKVMFLRNNVLARIFQTWVPSLHFSFRIFKVVANNDAEFVVVNGTYWSPNVVIALLVSKIKKRTVAYWSEPVFATNNRLTFWSKHILLIPVRKCTDFILAIGERAEKSFRKYKYSKPIFHLPYNINNQLFSRHKLARSRLTTLTKKYKSQGEVVLTTSGSLISRKGMDIVIKAFLSLNLNARLLIIGDGRERDSLELLAKDSERVSFLGFLQKDEIPYVFNVADIYVCASRYDGWGLVINEAIAADLAVISSDAVGAAVDQLKHDFNAIIFKSGNVHELAEAMQELIINEPKRKVMIENAQEVKERLSSSFNSRRLLKIFQERE